MANPNDESRRWRRKTSAEFNRDAIQRRRAKWNPIVPSVIAVLLTMGQFARDVFGWRRPQALPVEEALRFSIVVGPLVFILAYLFQVVRGRGLMEVRTKLTICTRCFQIDSGRIPGACACGGPLADADRWTWNRCPKCKFDLRASDRRCPECGMVMEQQPSR